MTKRAFRILMIDDSDVILTRTAAALSEAGFDVFTTTQTFAAHRFLADVDLVIVDYYMPGIGGGELVKALRRALDPVDSECAFYLHTSDDAVARAFKELGFDGAFGAKGDVPALVKNVTAVARVLRLRSGRRRAAPTASR